MLRALNLPNTREIDTMQERLQQLRRDNFALKKEIRKSRAMLTQKAGAGWQNRARGEEDAGGVNRPAKKAVSVKKRATQSQSRSLISWTKHPVSFRPRSR